MSDVDADDPIPGEGDPVATGVEGGGEWPDKDTPPTGPAPGTDAAHAEVIEDAREPTTGPEVEANVEELYGHGDERAGVATMPTDERDRLLGDDAPAAQKPRETATTDAGDAADAQPGETVEEGTDVPAGEATASEEPAADDAAVTDEAAASPDESE